MRYKLIFSLLLTQAFYITSINAQKLDSILAKLNAHTAQDTVRLNLLLAAGVEYQLSDLKKGLEISGQAVELAKTLNIPEKLADAYNANGAQYFLRGDFPAAEKMFAQALELYTSNGVKRGMADSYTNLGSITLKKSEYFKAIGYYENALKLYREIKSEAKELFPLSNISRAYITMTNFPRALEYAQQARVIAERLNNRRALPTVYNGLGDIYSELPDLELAHSYFKKSLAISRETGNKRAEAAVLQKMAGNLSKLIGYELSFEYLASSMSIAEAGKFYDILIYDLTIAAELHIRLKEYSLAMAELERAAPVAASQADKRLESGIKMKMGVCMIYAPDSALVRRNILPKDRYTKATELLLQAVNTGQEVKNLQLQLDAYQFLSEVKSLTQDGTGALDYYKKYIVIRDSILNDDKRKEIQRLNLQFDFNRKKDSIEAQQRITDEQLKQQRLLAKQQQQQLELNRQQIALGNKEKDIQRLAYLKTQSDLQNEQLQKRAGDRQLTIAQKEKQLQSTQMLVLTKENDLNKLKRNRQWFYSAAIVVLLLLLSGYFIYQNRLKQSRLKMELANEKAVQEKKEAEFQRSLADVSLTALRSQMNPHFIFNCLNSIKLYTTQNDTNAASEYLTKFSKLIRLVMENSRNECITLAAELEALRLYIDMEAMRFKEKLKYQITVDDDVEAEYIEIPPLLLQPYVENSIWHGLMHKETGGKIDIEAGLKDNKTTLQIVITDNGIGRARSEELRSKTATKHKSYGMKVTSERIALINKIYKTGTSVTIHDVTDLRGEANGTRVVIQIPLS